MKNKALLITVLVLVVVLGAAGLLYPKLSALSGPQQLAPAPTAAPTETTETTEATETTAVTEPSEQETAPTETQAPELVAAPDFTVLDMQGNEVSFSDYLGKPIVLNIWAHWCGACQYEMPQFNAAWEALEGEVTFLMVHQGAAVDKAKELVEQGGYTFPVLLDTESQVSAIYGVTAYPTSFFIDAEGYLRGWYAGAMDAELLQVGLDRIYTP